MKKTYNRFFVTLMEIFDLGPTVALTVMFVTVAILFTGVVFFFKSAPPTKLTISSGPDGSISHGIALKYADALKKNKIKVEVLTSKGSLENLKRISTPHTKVDLAFVQGGSDSESTNFKNIVSLGGISYQPLFFFYRGKPVERLADLNGKTIVIGKEGSGSRRLALRLLELNHMDKTSNLITMKGEDVPDALIQKKIDGAFMMGENASVKVLRALMTSEDIHLLSFKNAAAYARKVDILHIIDLPEGYIDFGKNIPHESIKLLGPMLELITTRDLHPALSDMILDAATEIHSSPGIFRKRGEFPMAVQNRIPLSDDAERFYKSGKSFLYRYLPFWLASLLNRMLVSLLPMLLILIPAVRSVPMVFRWLGQLRIRRRYRALLRLEAKFKHETNPERLKDLEDQFEAIEKDVQQMKVRATFADQFYSLRSHIDYVRKLMLAKMGSVK